MVRFIIIFAILTGLTAADIKAKTSIAQLQPSSWWTNMEMKQIKILVQGENINPSTIQTSYPNVTISNIQPTQNPNFITFDLTIQPNATPGIVKFDFIQTGKKYATIDFPLEVSNKAARQPISRSDIIYHILPDRFVNGNPANDNPEGYYERADRLNPAGVHGGDFAGINQQLTYIQQLGASAIELTPVNESNQFFSSYDKAAITNHYNTDARLGSLDELKNLVKTAQSNKLKVILTLLLNQIGTQNPIVTMAPFKQWVNSNPAVMGADDINPAMFDPNAAASDKQLAYQPWPDTDIASLNHDDNWLRQYLVQNCIWWIGKTGVNAIKIEHTCLNQPAFLTQLGQQLTREFPGLSIISDINTSNPIYAGLITAYMKSSQTITADYTFSQSVNDAFNELTQPNAGLMKLYNAFTLDFCYTNAGSNIVFADNYLTTRAFSSADKEIDQLKMMLAVTLTVRGIPQLCYGTELLLDGDIIDGKGFARKDMPGFLPSDAANAFTGRGLTQAQSEFSSWLRNLINWRKSSTAINEGTFIHFKPENGLYIYFRKAKDETIMVIVNNNQIEKTRFEPSRYIADPGQPVIMKDVLTGQQYSDFNNIILLPKSVTILKLARPGAALNTK
jgi:glycosidase